MTGTTYTQKNTSTIIRQQQASITNLQGNISTLLPLSQPGRTQELTFQFHATQFVGIPNSGDARVYANSAPSPIDEETNAAVAAYATFNDMGGTGAASNSIFDAAMTRVPLEDNEGRTAYYHGHWKYLRWSPDLHPNVTHTKQFMLSHSIELNVPGTDTLDKQTFVYYGSHANFNISTSISMSLWFYPTDISQNATEFFRFLIQRYIDASNHFLITIADGGADIGKIVVFINEGGVPTKFISSGTVNLNTWNLLIITYNPTTNTLVMYLNNSTASSVYGGAIPGFHTGDSNMYLGGRPFDSAVRFTGYFDNFVFWTGKILTSTEAGLMWVHGTIV